MNPDTPGIAALAMISQLAKALVEKGIIQPQEIAAMARAAGDEVRASANPRGKEVATLLQKLFP
jgi:hypothetical protein